MSEKMKETKQRLILDLASDRPDGDLQPKVMERLQTLLSAEKPRPADIEDDSFDQIEPSRTPNSLRVDDHHKHRAILLAGRRGEGKTTLLTDLLLQLEEGQFRSSKALGSVKLFSLGLLDPTMLENKQNVILSVISRINDIVEHRHRCGDRSGTARDQSFQELREALALLAQGVTVLDGVGSDLHKGDDWTDARFIMEHGLQRTKAAYGFRRHLDAYIQKAAQYLGCLGFVLCFDDVDTRFDMGRPVLEALRKYLTSPHLHVIVAGDPELMLTLVRRMQWEEMGEKFIKFEHEVHPRDSRASQLDSALQHIGSLTDQYLTKLFPIDRRLRLQTLEELDQEERKAGGILVKGRTRNEMGLRGFLKGMIEDIWGLRQTEDQEHLCGLILRMPIRSALVVLRAWDGAQNAMDKLHPTLEALLQISQTELRDADAPVTEILRKATPEATFALVVTWLSKRGMWRDYGDLTTHFADERQDRIAFTLAALFAIKCRGDLGAILTFWLGFALLQDRVEHHEAVLENSTGSPQAEDVMHLHDFLGIGRLERPIVQLGRLAAWDRGLPEGRRVTGGLSLSGFAIPAGRIRNFNEAFRTLYGKKWIYAAAPRGSGRYPNDDRKPLVFFEKGRRVAEFDDLIGKLPNEIRPYHERLQSARPGGYPYGGTRQYLTRAVCNTVESLAEGLTGQAKTVVHLPYSIVVSGQAAAFGNYGFRRLLGFLIEVLAVPVDEKGYLATQALKAVIEQSTITRGYSTPFARSLGIEEEGEEEADEKSEDSEVAESDPTLDGLAHALSGWASRTHSALAGQTIAPKVLLAVWKRFNFAQGRLFEDLSSKSGEDRRYLGYAMDRSVVMFLHAVGVETLRSENQPIQASVQSNPIHDDRLFLRLLDGMESDYSRTAGGRLFAALFECPLWGFFLKESPRTEGSRQGAVETVRSRYVANLPEGKLSASLFQTHFTPAGQNMKPVDFEGLYYLLNSVYLQR